MSALANRRSGEIAAVTLWESEEALHATEGASYWLLAFSAEAAGGEVTGLERYPGAELRGEVVVLAVYYPGSLELARELGDRLTGKVVVDISNPLTQTFEGLA